MSDELKEKPPEHVWVRHIYKCGSRYSFVASDDDMGRNFEYVRADLSRAPALAEENARLQAENAELRQALEPFAEIAVAYEKSDAHSAKHYTDEGRRYTPHSDHHRTSIALGDCRKARAALAQNDRNDK